MDLDPRNEREIALLLSEAKEYSSSRDGADVAGMLGLLQFNF